MQYILTPIETAQSDLQKRLTHELETGKKVLWLVSGGSNIDATVAIQNKLDEELTENLSIMLIDERYGQPGHADSNWQQLMQAGFSPKKAHLMPVLLSNSNLDRTAMHYNNMTAQAFAENDVAIAQLGMGPDGHIAGILPHSMASKVSQQLAVGYEHESFNRLTLTFAAIEMVDAVYLFVYGESKRDALLKLRDEGLSPEDHPAQFLKQLPEVHLYNDQLTEDS